MGAKAPDQQAQKIMRQLTQTPETPAGYDMRKMIMT